MKVTITLSNPMASEYGTKEVYRDERVIYGSCKSEPPHRMDCQRAVYVSFWESKKTLEEALEIFKRRLRDVVYEDQNLEFEVIDKRQTHLPHKNQY